MILIFRYIVTDSFYSSFSLFFYVVLKYQYQIIMDSQETQSTANRGITALQVVKDLVTENDKLKEEVKQKNKEIDELTKENRKLTEKMEKIIAINKKMRENYGKWLMEDENRTKERLRFQNESLEHLGNVVDRSEDNDVSTTNCCSAESSTEGASWVPTNPLIEDVPISQCTETLYKEELGFFDGNIYLRGMSPCTELARNPATESTNKSVDNLSNSVVSSNALLPYEPDSESSDIIIEAVLKQERLSPGPSSLVPNKFNDSPRTSTSNVSFSKETKAGPAPVISSIRGNTCTQKQSLLPTSSSSQHYELNDSSHTSSAAWSSKKKRGPSNSEYPMQEKKKTIGRCCYCLETVGMRNLRTHMMEMHGNNEHVLRCRVQTCGIVLSLDPDVECRHYKAKHPDEIEYRSKQTDEYRSHSSKDENKLIVTRQETCKNIDRLKEIWQTIRKERK